MKRSLYTSGLALCLLALAWGGANLHAGGKKEKEPSFRKVTSVEGITEYELSSNGLRVLLFPDSAASTVTVNMTILVGSRHEGYGETGMAHLLEHMLFKGSPKFPNPDKDLQRHGAESNGTTWTDRTNYYETMPASDANLKFGIELEADRIVNCFIKREDLLTEMTVVRNEFEQGENDPFSILNQRMMAVAFEWHNYGQSTIGNRSDIERVPIDKLKAFYQRYYQPNNAVLTIAGKFEEAKALEYIEQFFGPIPRSKHKIEATYTDEPAQDGERVVVLRRVGKVPVVGVMFHSPAAAHADTPALDVLASALGTAPSGRIYKALVETGKASQVSVDVSNWHDPGVFEIYAFVSAASTPEEVRDIILKVLDDVKTKPVTEEEATRAKTAYASAFERGMANSKGVGQNLSEWIGAGDWRLKFLYRDRMAKVSPAEATAVAEKYLKQSNRTVGLFIPSKAAERTPIPETPDLAALLKDYKGGKSIALGETFDPTPENIEGRVKRLELSNGLKVVLLAKKTRGETVVGQISLHFGNEESLLPYKTAGSFMGSLMSKGTKKHTREQLKDELDKLKSTLGAGSGLGTLTFTWQSKRDQQAAVLDLLREMLHEPTFPDSELEILIRNQREALEKAMVDPQGLAFRTLMRLLHPYPADDIRYIPTFDESLKRLAKVDRASIVKLYEGQVAAKIGEIAIVGDFDADATVKKLEAIFAGFDKKTPPYRRIEQKADTAVKGKKENILTPDKEGATYAAAHLLSMRDDDPLYVAAELGNYVLGGNFNSRLVDRLRQKEGLCYGAGSELNVDAQDKYGTFIVYAICNPENIDKVDNGALEEVIRLLKKGVDPAELELARKGYLEEMRVQRSKDMSIASTLRNLTHLGRTFKYYSDFEGQIAKLSLSDVNRALATVVQPDRLVIVRAGDFNKKAAPEKEKK